MEGWNKGDGIPSQHPDAERVGRKVRVFPLYLVVARDVAIGGEQDELDEPEPIVAIYDHRDGQWQRLTSRCEPIANVEFWLELTNPIDGKPFLV